MMRQFNSYFRLQLKRVGKVFPTMALTTLVMFICLGIFVTAFIDYGEPASDKSKYRIGIVGNASDTYLGFGINAVKSLDDSRFMVDFEFLSEKEARERLAMGELTAYVVIPDGLIDSLDTGANDLPILYYTAEGQKGITSILMDRLAGIVSDMVTDSQGTIYSMQQILYEHGRTDEIMDATDRLNIHLIELILNRSRLCNVEILGVSDGMSVEMFYFCTLLLFFILISGINSSSLFGKRSRELQKMLAGRGFNAAGQVMGEYLAYLCLTAVCLVEIFPVLCIAASGDFEISFLVEFFIRLIPVIVAVTAMQFMLYEFVSGIVSGIMVQFICAMSMAYISGYFYPERFFPETIQKIGKLLPTGVALSYASGGITGDATFAEFAALSAYIAAFLFVAVLVRKYRIRRG